MHGCVGFQRPNAALKNKPLENQDCVSHYFLPDGEVNWNGECPIRPIIGWGGLNCWAMRGWGAEGVVVCPTAPPPDPELALEPPPLLLFWYWLYELEP